MLGSLGLLHLTYSSSSSGSLSSSKDYPSPRLSHPKLPSFPLLQHRVLCPPSNLRCGKLERDCKVRAVLTDDSSRMTMSEGEMEDVGVLRTDSNLQPYKDHFKYRIKRYLEQKSLIGKYWSRGIRLRFCEIWI